jgi:hypothetical protein
VPKWPKAFTADKEQKMITRGQAVFMMFVGFLMTFGAVGAIENDGPLLDGIIIALVGLGVMGCGVLTMKRLDS